MTARAAPWWPRLAPALLLALLAVACTLFAYRLRHAGLLPLGLSAAILAFAAAGVALRLRGAWLFALAFFAVTAVVLLTATGALGLSLVGGGRKQGHAFLGVIVTVVLAFIVAGAATIATIQAVVLWRGRAVFTRPGLPAVLAVPLALAALSFVAWALAHEVWWKQMWVREICATGNAAVCASLADDVERFDAAERAAFARAGCAGGNARACAHVASTLARAVTEDDAALLAQQCEQGNADVCLMYAKAIPEPMHAAALTRACDLQVSLCSRAAEAARDRADNALMRALLARGCEAQDRASCWLVYVRVVPTLAEPERSRVELAACLATDVNACGGLMRRDPETFCPQICAGSGNDNRGQSCDHCGRTVRDDGRRDLAEAWFAGNCERGYAPSCRHLDEMLAAQGRTRPAATPRPATARSPAIAGTPR